MNAWLYQTEISCETPWYCPIARLYQIDMLREFVWLSSLKVMTEHSEIHYLHSNSSCLHFTEKQYKLVGTHRQSVQTRHKDSVQCLRCAIYIYPLSTFIIFFIVGDCFPQTYTSLQFFHCCFLFPSYIDIIYHTV